MNKQNKAGAENCISLAYCENRKWIGNGQPGYRGCLSLHSDVQISLRSIPHEQNRCLDVRGIVCLDIKQTASADVFIMACMVG